MKTIPKRLGRISRANPVNIDTGVGGGGWEAGHKSVPINGVSVLSGVNFRENVRAYFPQGKGKLSVIRRYP